MMRKACGVIMLLLIGTVMLSGGVLAQTGAPGRIDVFLTHDLENKTSSIYFQDALSGLSTVVHIENGRHFTLAGDYVLYEKIRTGAIMRIHADGRLEPHPFIRHGIETATLRWVVSPDQAAIAWVEVSTTGVSTAYAAWVDGRDQRQLPISTPAAPFELMPLALTNGLSLFFYDSAYQATPAGEIPYTLYEHITAYSLVDEQFYPLPREPNCLCSAAVSTNGRIFARLEARHGNRGPFALHVWDLPTNADFLIPAPDFSYQLAGDLLLNDNGTVAVYSVLSPAETDQEADDYTLVLVDVVTQQQTLVHEPGPLRYRPLSFIDEDNLLLLTGVTAEGTYKLDLASHEFQRVSDIIYLGTIIMDQAGE